MEQDRRLVLGEHLAHPLLLLAVGQDRDRGADVALVLELAADLEQVVLGVVDQHEPPRAHPGDLAAQLGADRAAGAGHHHDLAGQVGADALELLADGLAAEHVLDADLAQLAGDAQLARPVAQQLEHRRHRAHRDPAVATRRDDAPAQLARRRRDGDDHLVGLDLVEHARQVGVGVAQHLEAVLVLDAPLAGVVVEEARPGVRPSSGLRISSRTTRRPPSPPPTMSTSRAPLPARMVRMRPSTMSCTAKRAPMSRARLSRKNSAMTLTGSATGAWRDRGSNGPCGGAGRPGSSGVVGHCTGCSNAMTPTTMIVATNTPLMTAS